jgi:hypothetical protein
MIAEIDKTLEECMAARKEKYEEIMKHMSEKK